jgi:hypothetical protein
VSIKLMHEVFGKEISHSEQAVLLAMADHADDDGGSCYPSVDRIAYKTGYKPRNVIRVMGDLRKKGALEIVAQATLRKPTEYRIHLGRLPDKPSFEEWRAANGRHVGRGANFAPVQNTDSRGAKSGTIRVHPDAPESSKEPSYKPSSRNENSEQRKKEADAARRRKQMEEVFGPNTI